MKKWILALLLLAPMAISAQNNEIKTWQVPGLGTAGPYSHAVEAGGFLYLSGVIPVNYETGQADTANITVATHRIFRNIRDILKYCETDLESVVKVTVYLRDLADFAEMNEAYKQWITKNFPARSTVEVSKIPLGMPIEIDMVVWKGEKK